MFLHIMWAEYSDIDVILSECCDGSEIGSHDDNKSWYASAYARARARARVCVCVCERMCLYEREWRWNCFQTHCVHSCIYFLLYITLFESWELQNKN